MRNILQISERPGNFSTTARAKMFISWQTFEGFQITVYSIIDVVKFLLKSGVPYVLTERFCQDLLEEYFGKQRQMGRRADNPDMHQFGYNNNARAIHQVQSKLVDQSRKFPQ